MNAIVGILEGAMFLAASILLVVSVDLRMSDRAGGRMPRVLANASQWKDDCAALVLAALGALAPARFGLLAYAIGAPLMIWLLRRTLSRARRVPQVS